MGIKVWTLDLYSFAALTRSAFAFSTWLFGRAFWAGESLAVTPNKTNRNMVASSVLNRNLDLFAITLTYCSPPLTIDTASGGPVTFRREKIA
jgi:hypothetical protein